MGLSHTVSETNGDFGRKSQNLPPGVFNAPAEGVSLEFYGSAKKTRMPPTRWCKKFDDMCIRLYAILQ